jgi:hypothetical protein
VEELKKASALVFALILFIILNGCESMARLTKPADPYVTQQNDTYTEEIYPGDDQGKNKLELTITCISENGGEAQGTGKTKITPCTYKAVSETEIEPYDYSQAKSNVVDATSQPKSNVVDLTAKEDATKPKKPLNVKFSPIGRFFSQCNSSKKDSSGLEDTCTKTRNAFVDVLVKVTDENCSAFLQNVFFFKSSADSFYNTTRDGLSGGTAIAALPSPPTALALSIGNLFVRSYESVNKSFFLSETFQPIESAINLVRLEKLKELNDCLKQAPYSSCSIHKAMGKVKDYSDACSLRVGLNKLQLLVHENSESRKKVEEQASKADQSAKTATTAAESATTAAKNATTNALNAEKKANIAETKAAEAELFAGQAKVVKEAVDKALEQANTIVSNIKTISNPSEQSIDSSLQNTPSEEGGNE